MREFFASETYGLERRFPILETGRACFFVDPVIPPDTQAGDVVAVPSSTTGGPTSHAIVEANPGGTGQQLRRLGPDGRPVAENAGVIP